MTFEHLSFFFWALLHSGRNSSEINGWYTEKFKELRRCQVSPNWLQMCDRCDNVIICEPFFAASSKLPEEKQKTQKNKPRLFNP